LKKIFISILCYLHLTTTIVSDEVTKSNLKIFKDLDIETSYIKDQKFQEYYNNFFDRHERTYESSLNRGEKYIPEISNILEENNIPSVFLYMAMAESNFVLEAKSSKKALGIWQFMPGTAKELGLKKTKYVDERLDFIKSTQAAVKYLTKLHKIFGSWYLAALSYNCGDGRLIEGITRATLDLYCERNDCSKDKTIAGYKKTLKDYDNGRAKFKDINEIYKVIKTWDLQPTLNDLLTEKKGAARQYVPAESRNYIKKIISLAMIKNEKVKDGNSFALSKEREPSLIRVESKEDKAEGKILKNVATLAGIAPESVKKTNANTKEAKPEMKDLENIESDYVKTYIVKKGDNLFRIAKENGVTMEALIKENNLKSKQVKPGDKIVIKVR